MNKNVTMIITAIGLLAFLFFIVFSTIHLLPEQEKNFCGLFSLGEEYSPQKCNSSCISSSDCVFSCGCGAINNKEKCEIGKTKFDCETYPVRCEQNRCVVRPDADGECRFSSPESCDRSCTLKEDCKYDCYCNLAINSNESCDSEGIQTLVCNNYDTSCQVGICVIEMQEGLENILG